MNMWKRVASVSSVLMLVAAATAFSGEGAKSDEKSKADIAAQIGNETISIQDVDARAFKTNMKLADEVYKARLAALDELLLEKFVRAEAAEKGKDYSALLNEKIAAKTMAVTDADVEKWYNDNKNRMGGQTLEQVADQIRIFLTNNKEKLARLDVIKELKAKHDVKVVLDAPRVKLEIGPHERTKGPATAKVTIVEYSDFQCPFCSRAAATVKQLVDEYKDKVRVVFRDNAMAMHQRAAAAAEAAMCAHEQGKFWEFHDKLFGDQKKMSDEDFKQHAADLALDVEKFNACYTGGKYRDAVKKETDSTRDLGITGAPAFFVNGRFLSGAQPIEIFKLMIDEELERQN